jgi:hypothetical protein
MDQGASQAAISEYGHASLSPEQSAVLSDAYGKLNKRVHNGEHALPYRDLSCLRCLQVEYDAVVSGAVGCIYGKLNKRVHNGELLGLNVNEGG